MKNCLIISVLSIILTSSSAFADTQSCENNINSSLPEVSIVSPELREMLSYAASKSQCASTFIKVSSIRDSYSRVPGLHVVINYKDGASETEITDSNGIACITPTTGKSVHYIEIYWGSKYSNDGKVRSDKLLWRKPVSLSYGTILDINL